MPVYIIASSPSNKIKIGKSGLPESRLRGLQQACWEDLRIIRLVPGAEWEEYQFHHRFRHLRINRKRDWYEFDPAMMTFVPDPPPNGPLRPRNEALIRLIREAHMTPLRLSLDLGVPHSEVARWRNGAPVPEEYRERLSDFLGPKAMEATQDWATA